MVRAAGLTIAHRQAVSTLASRIGDPIKFQINDQRPPLGMGGSSLIDVIVNVGVERRESAECLTGSLGPVSGDISQFAREFTEAHGEGVPDATATYISWRPAEGSRVAICLQRKEGSVALPSAVADESDAANLWARLEQTKEEPATKYVHINGDLLETSGVRVKAMVLAAQAVAYRQTP